MTTEIIAWSIGVVWSAAWLLSGRERHLFVAANVWFAAALILRGLA